MTASGALVAFDFAGTLSLDTVRFARPDRLTAALRASGLAALGVDTPEVFWSRIIEPTWQRGSTTGVGYATVVAEATTDLRRARRQPVDAAAIRAAAAAFTARYLASSTIADPWWPWLRALVDRPDVTVVIATDHYAELTGHLVSQLDAADVGGTAPPRQGGMLTGRRVGVANSADLGCHKADAAFWSAVGRALPTPPAAVLVVDDFGANEDPGGTYGDPAAVRRRRDRTVAVLTDTFGLPPTVHTFDADPEGADRPAIDRAGRGVDALLALASPATAPQPAPHRRRR